MLIIRGLEEITTRIGSSLARIDTIDKGLESTITGFLSNLDKQLNENVSLNLKEIADQSIERIKEVGKRQGRLSTEIYDSGAFILASVDAMEGEFNKATEKLSSSINRFEGTLSGRLEQLEKVADRMAEVQKGMKNVTDGWKDNRDELKKAIGAFKDLSQSIVPATRRLSESTNRIADIFTMTTKFVSAIENKSKQAGVETEPGPNSDDSQLPKNSEEIDGDHSEFSPQLSAGFNHATKDSTMTSPDVGSNQAKVKPE